MIPETINDDVLRYFPSNSLIPSDTEFIYVYDRTCKEPIRVTFYVLNGYIRDICLYKYHMSRYLNSTETVCELPCETSPNVYIELYSPL